MQGEANISTRPNLRHSNAAIGVETGQTNAILPSTPSTPSPENRSFQTIAERPHLGVRPDTIALSQEPGFELIGKFRNAIQSLQGADSYFPTILDRLVLSGIAFGDVTNRLQTIATEFKKRVFSKENAVVRDRTAAWWLGYIRREWELARRQGVETGPLASSEKITPEKAKIAAQEARVHNSLAGAAGVFGFNDTPEGFMSDLDASGNVLRPKQVAEFITQSIVGLWESQRMMNDQLGMLWVALDAEKIIPKYEDRTYNFQDRLAQGALREGWNKLVRTYGFWHYRKEVAAADGGTTTLNWTEHLAEFRAYLDFHTGKEAFRTEEESSSIRLIVYTKSRESGEWENQQVIVKLPSSTSPVDQNNIFHQVQTALQEVKDQPSSGSSLTGTRSKPGGKPIFEVALVVHKVGETEDTLPLQLDQKGVAERAPVARLVVDYQNDDKTHIGDPVVAPGKIRALRTQFPHYAVNEDGARHIVRRLRQKLLERYPMLRFESPRDRTTPRVIRRETDVENRLETVEVSSEVSLSKPEADLLKDVRNADAYRIGLLQETERARLSPMGFAQLATLATSTMTRQPGYLCISPDSDLQIGFCPWSDNQALNVVADQYVGAILWRVNNLLKDKVQDEAAFHTIAEDFVDYLLQKNENRTEAPKRIREELADYSNYTGEQITFGRKGMALLPVLDTYTPGILRQIFDLAFPRQSRHIQGATAQVSSVFHDPKELRGEMQFITAGAKHAKLAVALRSTPDGKSINLRHRYEKDDLQLLAKQKQSRSNTDLENEIVGQTDRILKTELRLRLILVNIAYMTCFSDPKKFDEAKVKNMMARAIAEVFKQD